MHIYLVMGYLNTQKLPFVYRLVNNFKLDIKAGETEKIIENFNFTNPEQKEHKRICNIVQNIRNISKNDIVELNVTFVR